MSVLGNSNSEINDLVTYVFTSYCTLTVIVLFIYQDTINHPNDYIPKHHRKLTIYDKFVSDYSSWSNNMHDVLRCFQFCIENVIVFYHVNRQTTCYEKMYYMAKVFKKRRIRYLVTGKLIREPCVMLDKVKKLQHDMFHRYKLDQLATVQSQISPKYASGESTDYPSTIPSNYLINRSMSRNK
jgi:hypothetical protein